MEIYLEHFFAAQRLALLALGAGVDSAREQGKLEARKMLENATRREVAVPGVQCTLCWLAGTQDLLAEKRHCN